MLVVDKSDGRAGSAGLSIAFSESPITVIPERDGNHV